MTKQERAFIQRVRAYYRRHGRQVERVIPKYREFLSMFPSPRVLASASLGEVLRAWQGLGYNRRAQMLHKSAKVITKKFRGRTPKSYDALRSLPGIGPDTAGAVMAFAYNIPAVFIETNIRSVYLHHFFYDSTDVNDVEIFRLIERTLDRENPREWYYALMDYGVFLKKTIGNQNSRSRHYTKQSTFKNSDRQIRGAILHLLAQGTYTRKKMHEDLPFEIDRIDAQCENLLAEGLIVLEKKQFRLP